MDGILGTGGMSLLWEGVPVDMDMVRRSALALRRSSKLGFPLAMESERWWWKPGLVIRGEAIEDVSSLSLVSVSLGKSGASDPLVEALREREGLGEGVRPRD